MQVTTIKEIALLSGVSISTVSRVLNHFPDVNEATRKKVLSVIDENSYVPNANAKNLKQLSSKVICIVVRGIENAFFTPILETIQSDVEAAGYTPLLHHIDEREEELAVAKRLVVEKKAEGIIILGGSIEDRREEVADIAVPCVFVTISAESLGLAQVSSVFVDDRKAASMAVDHLLELGHRDIAVLGGQLGQHDLVYHRFEGARDSFAAHGLTFDQQNYLESKFSMGSAYEAVSVQLSKRNRFVTALFAMSDVMAIGAIRAILDFGLRVPEDISVIGYDGIPISEFYNPSLTTIHQPAHALAHTSAQLVLDTIAGRQSTGQHIVLETRLVKGQSTSARA
ncbi:MAG: LacI family DNA-binding transcriptional regulator [Angelakisella sp.]